MTGRARQFEVALFLGVGLVHLAIALGSQRDIGRWFRLDDAFYYFKTAQNIAEGHGSTFDGIALTNGYHPLWMAICVPIFALARFDLWIPLRVVIIVSGLLNAGAGVILFRMVSRAASPSLGAVTATFWTLWQHVHTTTTQLGLENPINAFLFALSLYSISKLPKREPPSHRQAWAVAVLLTLLVLARLDNIFVALLLGLWVVAADNPYRMRLILYTAVVLSSLVISIVIRVGPALVPGFKDAVVVALALSVPFKMPALVLIPRHASPSWRRRLGSLAVASAAGSILLGLPILGMRVAGLPVFPRLALAYDWAITTVMLLLLEVLLAWLGVARPEQKALETIRPMWRRALSVAAIIFGLLGSTLLVYALANQAIFGTPLPVSGQVKEWWGTIYSAYGRPPTEVDAFFGLDPSREAAPFQFPAKMATFFQRSLWTRYLSAFLVGWALASLVLLRDPDTRRLVQQYSMLPLGTGVLALSFFYAIRGYQNMGEWYWIGIVLFTVLGFSLFLHAAFRRLSRLGARPSADVVAASVLVGLIVFHTGRRLAVGYFAEEPVQVPAQSDHAAFLESTTPPGAKIGIPGSGGRGYFITSRTIVNLDGLANSYEYFDMSRRRQGGAYLEAIGLDYVYSSPGLITVTEPYMHTFRDRLERVTDYRGQVLYRFLPTEKTK